MTISCTHLLVTIWYRPCSTSGTVQCSPSEWGNSPVILNLKSESFVFDKHGACSIAPCGRSQQQKKRELLYLLSFSAQPSSVVLLTSSRPPSLPALPPAGWHRLPSCIPSWGHIGLTWPTPPASAAGLEPVTQRLCSWAPESQTQKRRLRKDCKQHGAPVCRSWIFQSLRVLKRKENLACPLPPPFFPPDLATQTGISNSS